MASLETIVKLLKSDDWELGFITLRESYNAGELDYEEIIEAVIPMLIKHEYIEQFEIFDEHIGYVRDKIYILDSNGETIATLTSDFDEERNYHTLAKYILETNGLRES